MDVSNVVVSPREVKPVIRWDNFPEPWRTIGPGFADECAAIISGIVAAPPKKTWPTNDLKQLREARGLSQKAVSRMVGCYPQHVSDAERGKRPKWERIIRAALEEGQS